jgi:glycerol-3-phosphate cytidylyltransferase
LNLIRLAKSLGTRLIIGLSSDDFNKLKGKTSFQSFDERKINLESIRHVDFVFEENNWEQKINDVITYKVDLFVIGDDWIGKFDFLKDYCEVAYLPRTEQISSTMIRRLIK